MKYFIKDNFYFDIDKFNQLRLTGPQNHLLCGFTFPQNSKLNVVSYDIVKKQLSIELRLSAKVLETSIPVVTDVRTIRIYTENIHPTPLYSELVQKIESDIVPTITKVIKRKDSIILRFTNSFIDETGRNRIFGVKFIFPKEYEVNLKDKNLIVKSNKDLKLKILTISPIPRRQKLPTSLFNDGFELASKNFDENLIDLYKKSGQVIEHLIRAHKTGSFEYGTIFPRDWVESADLGSTDLNPQIIDYMYAQSMKYISETGEGWHEEVVGAYRTKVGPKSFVDRKMIDIEPRYIIGMKFVTNNFFFKKENRRKLKLVANYILRNAEEKELITFKRIPESHEEYYRVGNWRDSTNAFPSQKSPLAPYDVNCIFYPVSLNIIREYNNFFQIQDKVWLDSLIDKWMNNKQKFRMYHPHNIIGYAIALHGKKSKPLPVSHLDESYDMFYGNPTLEETVSFAQKLMDPDFFYTPVGPLLVANDEDDYNSEMYHGQVIWPKQAAFTVAGLSKQIRHGLTLNWPLAILKTIKDAAIQTCEACFKGWQDLGIVPELYYYDEKQDSARLFTDQERYEGPMGVIQLWSSVGARRIMREYAYLTENPF